MILVCNAIRNDLIHPNEFVRGSSLRFLCKVKDEESFTHLMPSIKACLEHRHPYVHKNALLTVFHAHKVFGDNLIPDSPVLVETFINSETDMAAQRNAFLMLYNEADELAIEYLANNIDEVQKLVMVLLFWFLI